MIKDFLQDENIVAKTANEARKNNLEREKSIGLKKASSLGEER